MVFAAPAGADPQDQQFFRTLDRLGFVMADPPLLISQGRMICNEGLAHGVSWGEMHGQPERSAEWCRTLLARGRDSHTLTTASLVLSLAIAGSVDEAKPPPDPAAKHDRLPG